jgi:hypothetical protein
MRLSDNYSLLESNNVCSKVDLQNMCLSDNTSFEKVVIGSPEYHCDKDFNYYIKIKTCPSIISKTPPLIAYMNNDKVLHICKDAHSYSEYELTADRFSDLELLKATLRDSAGLVISSTIPLILQSGYAYLFPDSLFNIVSLSCVMMSVSLSMSATFEIKTFLKLCSDDSVFKKVKTF